MKKKEPEPILFIINPIAGIRRIYNVDEIIRKHLNGKKFDAIIRFTEYKGHASEIARKGLKKGIRKIVAVGGDGTVNEVASALRDKDAALGIIPMGSGNGLARHLRIPVRVRAAVEVLNWHKEISIDYGEVNGVPFFCTCGAGFDAFVGKRFAEHETRGFVTYVKTTLAEYVRYKPHWYKLKIGKKSFHQKAFLVTFANAAQWGNNAFISPNANIQDGLLDICMVAPFPVLKAMNIGVRLFSRRIETSQYVNVIRSEDAVLKRKKAGPVHVDGEPSVMKKKLKIKTVHKGLRVMVHDQSKFD